jgi:hypothetical protein
MFEGKIHCDTCGTSTPVQSCVTREKHSNDLVEVIYSSAGFFEYPVLDADGEGFTFRHFCSQVCLRVEASKVDLKGVEPIKKEEMN